MVSFHTALQIILRMIAQLVHRGFYVASPVALAQNVVFVVVERGYLPCALSYPLAKECHDAQQPYRGSDAYPPRTVQPSNVIAECG